jgi:hypothetical protein
MAKCKTDNGNKTFIKITNRDIYQEIVTLRNQLKTFIESNEEAHNRIINLPGKPCQFHNTIYSKSNITKWIAGTSLTLSIIVIGWLFYLMNNLIR